MAFKNRLIIKGQASLEYFLLFSVIIVLTILSMTSFFPKVQAILQGTNTQTGFFEKAAGRLGVDNVSQ